MDRSVISFPLTIEREDVLFFLGYPEDTAPTEGVERLLTEVIEEARSLVDARGVYVELSPRQAPVLGLEPMNATALVAGLVTIGDALEIRATELLKRSETTRALLLDAAGSAAVEETADRLSGLVAGDSPSESVRHVPCRISPGYGHWPITSQKALFDLLPHPALNVALLPTMLMVPRKSISFAIWFGADTRPMAGLSGCTRCELEHCRYRRER